MFDFDTKPDPQSVERLEFLVFAPFRGFLVPVCPRCGVMTVVLVLLGRKIVRLSDGLTLTRMWNEQQDDAQQQARSRLGGVPPQLRNQDHPGKHALGDDTDDVNQHG